MISRSATVDERVCPSCGGRVVRCEHSYVCKDCGFVVNYASYNVVNMGWDHARVRLKRIARSNREVRYAKIVRVLDTQPIKLTEAERKEVIMLSNKILDGLFRVGKKVRVDLVVLVSLYLVLRKYRKYSFTVFSNELGSFFNRSGFYNALYIVRTRLSSIVRGYYSVLSVRDIVESFILRMRSSDVFVSVLRRYFSDGELEQFFMKVREYAIKIAELIENSHGSKSVLALACIFIVISAIDDDIFTVDDFASINGSANFIEKVPFLREFSQKIVHEMLRDRDVVPLLLKIQRVKRVQYVYSSQLR
jgi:hypothetical protein